MRSFDVPPAASPHPRRGADVQPPPPAETAVEQRARLAETVKRLQALEGRRAEAAGIGGEYHAARTADAKLAAAYAKLYKDNSWFTRNLKPGHNPERDAQEAEIGRLEADARRARIAESNAAIASAEARFDEWAAKKNATQRSAKKIDYASDAYKKEFMARYRGINRATTLGVRPERLKIDARREGLDAKGKNAFDKAAAWTVRNASEQWKGLEDKYGKERVRKVAKAIRLTATAAASTALFGAIGPLGHIGSALFRLGRAAVGGVVGASAAQGAGKWYERTLGKKRRTELQETGRDEKAFDEEALETFENMFKKGSTKAINRKKGYVEMGTAVVTGGTVAAGSGLGLVMGESLSNLASVQDSVADIETGFGKAASGTGSVVQELFGGGPAYGGTLDATHFTAPGAIKLDAASVAYTGENTPPGWSGASPALESLHVDASPAIALNPSAPFSSGWPDSPTTVNLDAIPDDGALKAAIAAAAPKPHEIHGAGSLPGSDMPAQWNASPAYEPLSEKGIPGTWQGTPGELGTSGNTLPGVGPLPEQWSVSPAGHGISIDGVHEATIVHGVETHPAVPDGSAPPEGPAVPPAGADAAPPSGANAFEADTTPPASYDAQLGDGGIRLVGHLKELLKASGHPSPALQKLLNTDPETLAKQLGLYRPGAKEGLENILVLKGDSLAYTSDHEVVLTLKGQAITLMHADGTIVEHPEGLDHFTAVAHHEAPVPTPSAHGSPLPNPDGTSPGFEHASPEVATLEKWVLDHPGQTPPHDLLSHSGAPAPEAPRSAALPPDVPPRPSAPLAAEPVKPTASPELSRGVTSGGATPDATQGAGPSAGGAPEAVTTANPPISVDALARNPDAAVTTADTVLATGPVTDTVYPEGTITVDNHLFDPHKEAGVFTDKQGNIFVYGGSYDMHHSLAESYAKLHPGKAVYYTGKPLLEGNVQHQWVAAAIADEKGHVMDPDHPGTSDQVDKALDPKSFEHILPAHA